MSIFFFNNNYLIQNVLIEAFIILPRVCMSIKWKLAYIEHNGHIHIYIYKMKIKGIKNLINV